MSRQRCWVDQSHGDSRTSERFKLDLKNVSVRHSLSVNQCPFLVTPCEAEGSAVRHSCAPPLHAPTSANHHRIRMETPTSALSFRVPGKVRRHRRSLGFAPE